MPLFINSMKPIITKLITNHSDLSSFGAPILTPGETDRKKNKNWPPGQFFGQFSHFLIKKRRLKAGGSSNVEEPPAQGEISFFPLAHAPSARDILVPSVVWMDALLYAWQFCVIFMDICAYFNYQVNSGGG